MVNWLARPLVGPMESEKVLLRQWKETQSSKLAILILSGIGIVFTDNLGDLV